MFFNDVITGKKRAELRKNDRDFKEGDILNLSEYDPIKNCYTGKGVTVVITHIQSIRDLDFNFKTIIGLNPCLASVNDLVMLSISII